MQDEFETKALNSLKESHAGHHPFEKQLVCAVRGVAYVLLATLELFKEVRRETTTPIQEE
jgi:hypothetical protein